MRDEQQQDRTTGAGHHPLRLDGRAGHDGLEEVFARVAAEEILREVGWPMTDEEAEAMRGDYEEEAEVDSGGQGDGPDLFLESGREKAPRRTPSVRRRVDAELARTAYLHVTREGRESIDRIVADPELNLRYIQACWSLGGASDPYQLNRLLLNARKAKRLGPLPRARRLRLPPSVLDECLTAVELAVRMVQDRAFFRRGIIVSLDRILCDPTYGREFEEYADVLAPGRRAFDYRWTALSLRKRVALGTARGNANPPLPFREVGYLFGDIDRHLDGRPGLIRLDDEEGRVLFVGHGGDLRVSAARLAGVPFERMASVMRGVPSDPSRLRCLVYEPEGPASFSRRTRLAAPIVLAQRPPLNVNFHGGRAA